MLKKRGVLLAILIALFSTAIIASAFFFVPIKDFNTKVYAETATGKKLLYDYDVAAWNSTYTVVDTTESVFPYGKMLRLGDKAAISNSATAWVTYAKDNGLTNLTDWTGVKYIMFYIENTATYDCGARLILNSLDPNYENAQQFIVMPGSTGVVYFDNLETCVSATVSTTTSNIVVPKGFKGYAKISVSSPDNFKAYLSDGIVRTPNLCLSEIQQVNFRGTEPINIDTLMVSYDDDITEVLTEKEVLCGRTVEGNNEITAISNAYLENSGYGGWDGESSGLSGFVSYDEYYSEMTVNAPKATTNATKNMVQKDNYLGYTNQSDWSSAKYFVMEFENHATTVSQIYPTLVVNIEGTKTYFRKAGMLPMFYKNADGSLTYASAKETFNKKSLIQVPASFDGFIVIPIVDFVEYEPNANTIISGGEKIVDYLDNINNFHLRLTWYNYAQNFTVGAIGYASNDLIKTDETSIPTIVNEGIIETLDNENLITPITGFVDTHIARIEGLENSSDFVSYTDDALVFNGTLNKSTMLTVNGFAELDKVDLASQELVIFDVKNMLATDAQVLVKIFCGANLYKLPYSAFALAKDDSSSYILSNSKTYLSIPANFDGQIIVAIDSFVGQNDVSLKVNSRDITGFGFAMPDNLAMNLQFGTPYFAQSIKAWKENATLIKLAQDDIVLEDMVLEVGETYDFSNVGQGNGAVSVVANDISQIVTIENSVVNAISEGVVQLKVTKNEGDFYLSKAGTVNLTINKASIFTDEEFYFGGASIKTRDNEEGMGSIRFRMLLKKSSYDALEGEVGVGVLLLPEVLKGANGLTKDTEHVVMEDMKEYLIVTDINGESYYSYTCYLYNIPQKYWSLGILARGYVSVGNEYYYTAEAESRSITQVAQSAYKNETDETIKTLIECFLPTVTFNVNGGEGSIEEVVILNGSNYTFNECNVIAPENKVFSGYEVNGTIYNVGDTITVNGKIEVKLIWGDN